MVGGGDSAPLVLFNSDSPVTGFANGFQQLFVYERQTNRKTQLTAGIGDSTHATMDLTGRFVLFQSTADIVGERPRPGLRSSFSTASSGSSGSSRTGRSATASSPSLAGNARYAAFVSTSDLLGTGAPVSQHLFIYDLLYDSLYQVTHGPGVSDNPVATADNIFFYDSTEDPMGMGIPGRFVYALNVFERLPNPLARQPGLRSPARRRPDGQHRAVEDPRRLVHRADLGRRLRHQHHRPEPRRRGARSRSRRRASSCRRFRSRRSVPSASRRSATGRASSTATAARAASTSTRSRISSLDASQDPNCLSGCRENDPSCQGPLTGPHFDPCPKCGAGTCTAGLNVGLVCTSDGGCPNGVCGGRTCDSGVRAGLACSAGDRLHADPGLRRRQGADLQRTGEHRALRQLSAG